MRSWKEFIITASRKGDRSTAILGGAYIKTHLGQLLETFMVEDPGVQQFLLGEERPLGGLYSRIMICYALGLISEHEYHDLLIIHTINNHFLRSLDRNDFGEEDIAELCRQLKTPRDALLPMEEQTPRSLYLFATAILSQQLSLRIQQSVEEKRQPRMNIICD